MKKKITMGTKKELSVMETYELFVRKAKVRNLSENTLKTYGYHYHAFTRFLDEGTPIKQITLDTVDEFILWLRENNNVKAVSVNSYLRTIRAFLYYAMDCGYMESFKIPFPKAEKKIKETYTDEELQRLLKRPDTNKCDFSEYKIWVFENYLLGTGNRISSALNVKIEDVNFSDGVIIIRKTKNRKQQIIPLSCTLAEILKEYLDIRGGDKEDYLFCNDFGEQACKRTYQQLVQRYNIKRNINKTSCHLFRHTFAKQWILAGGDIFRLQKILGHSTLDVTKEYLQMFGQDLQLDFEKFNPLDNMNKSKKRIQM